jgi:hypothetical protein
MGGVVVLSVSEQEVACLAQLHEAILPDVRRRATPGARCAWRTPARP